MRGTATAGQAVGWILIVVGAVLVPAALLSGYDDVPPGLRTGVRIASIGHAVAALATGIGFLVVSAILVALLEIRDAFHTIMTGPVGAPAVRMEPSRATTTHQAPSRYIHPAPAPASARPQWGSQTLPPRIEMVQRHGEAIGGRAWDIIRLGMKDGHVIPEAEAVGKARDEAGAVPRTEEEG